MGRSVSRVCTESSPAGFGWRFCTPLLVGATLNPINSSLIATAIVPIAGAMGVSVGRSAVLVSALYVATAIAQPTAGKLSEVFGARRVFLAGLLAVVAGGLVGGFGSSLGVLVAARVLIGVGTSSAYPAAMLLIQRRAARGGLTEPPGKVLGGLVIAGTVTAAAGLPIGGVLVGAWGWQSTFLINVPVGLAAIAITLAWIPAERTTAQRQALPRTLAAIDIVGVAGFGGTLSALLVFLLSWPHPRWVALGLAVALGGGLLWWELRVSAPFLDVRMLIRTPALVRTYLRFALTTMSMYCVLYGVTQWLQAGRGVSAKTTGLLLLPMTGLAALIAQPVAARNALRAPLIAAGVACLIGSIGTLLLSSDSPIVWVLVVTLIFGIALGTTTSANQTALYTQVPSEQIATASGLLRSCGYIGSIAAAAVISVAFHSAVTDQGLHTMAWILVGVSVIGVAALALDPIVVPRPGQTSSTQPARSKAQTT
ncbi:multidrug efflux MFS transporter [Mycobacterium avium subsp. hominissuis]|nr:multidrug efflux MFS transporter [Mycobacterium avium subsp. hominissuis]MBZ4609018.1 multidrug efflux MFS transporter [Mycobacterium avium subsp. hominissuis]